MTTSDNVEARPLLEPREGIPDVINSDIDAVADALSRGTGPFAVDTERAMGIRYSNRAYLIQIRREGAGTFLIDPIGVEDQFAELARVMDDEWILHAADQDLPCLRELGLEPGKIFDTELAGLILGFERVSLQAMLAEVLGWALAKEHSNADWSQRPLGKELLAYAALDVELLIELRSALIDMLSDAGRLDWFEQECEAVRLKKPNDPPQQPWRRVTRQADIRDRRSLAMVRELWNARDRLAQSRDLAPGKVLPNKVLAELASRKPRSRADVVNSSLMRSRMRRDDVDSWWNAINIAWHLDERALPERRFSEGKEPHPPVNRWDRLEPEAAERWSQVRSVVFGLADELGIRQDILLKPAHQKLLAWNGWENEDDLRAKLDEYGSRPWQIDIVAEPLAQPTK